VIRRSVTSVYLAIESTPPSLDPRRPAQDERTAVRRCTERKETDDGRDHHLVTPPPAHRLTGTLVRALGLGRLSSLPL
jgi:hypothetical protein